ncbi:hypothetical protein GGF37_002487 [Kickxella alabastrina]|nr:hypothetical protein GGF37_002487 [Kickxella alabastrina]
MTKLISIVGATSLQGGSVLKALYATGKYKSIELVKADADDTASLRQAFRGADIVFGMTQANMMAKDQDSTRDEEYEHGKTIIDSAISEGVNSLVFSTLDSMNTNSGGSKSDQSRGYFVNAGLYMENFVRFSRLSPEDAHHLGAVVSHILDHSEENLSKVREVSGGYYEAQEIVSAFTEATGIPARYVQLPYEYLGVEEAVQMFKGIDDFGSFNGRTELIERNKLIDYKFTTPV